MCRRSIFMAALLAGLITTITFPTQAATVTYSERNVWQNDVDPLTPIVTEDFNAQPLGSLIDNSANTVGLITVFPHEAPGSAIKDGTESLQIDGTQFLYTLVDGSPVRTMDISFSAPVYSFGFDFTELEAGDDTELTLGNGDNFRLSSIVGGAHAGFVGFICDTTFDTITFHDPYISFTVTGIDNLSFAIAQTQECQHHGDVNLDGVLSAEDAQITFNIVLEVYTPTFEEECAADCNSDDSITAGDAQSIFGAVLSLDSCVDPIIEATPTPLPTSTPVNK